MLFLPPKGGICFLGGSAKARETGGATDYTGFSVKNMKQILYAVAKNEKGELIQAKDSEKGNKFYCNVCDQEFILRKSGKIGKNCKRPHFAHRNLTTNCTPETALHFAFKNLLYKRIKTLVDKKESLPINWDCEFCYEQHSGNLLRKVASVELEYDLKACRPDIALLDANGKIYTVIEIVVTHSSDETVLEYYKNNDIILIKFDLESDQDLEIISHEVLKPAFIDFCINPKCKKCGNFKQKTRMIIVFGNCWKCKSKMKVAVIEDGMERGASHIRPSEFTKEEIEFAQAKGVIIKKKFSKTLGKSYLANTCGKCNAFAGDHYLFTDYVAYPEYESVTYDLGYHCERCYEIKHGFIVPPSLRKNRGAKRKRTSRVKSL